MLREETIKLYQDQSKLRDMLWDKVRTLSLSNRVLAKEIGVHPVSFRNWFLLNKRLSMVNVNKVINYLEK